MATEIEQKIIDGIQDILVKHKMIIDELKYLKKQKEYVLQIYVEREDLSSIDLDDIVLLSEDLSTRLDELDLIKDNYCLDVSTSGVDKPIKDFTKFNLLIGKYMEIRLKNPIKGMNIYQGELIKVDENSITLTYKEKTRSINVEIDLKNINKAKLTIKV